MYVPGGTETRIFTKPRASGDFEEEVTYDKNTRTFAEHRDPVPRDPVLFSGQRDGETKMARNTERQAAISDVTRCFRVRGTAGGGGEEGVEKVRARTSRSHRDLADAGGRTRVEISDGTSHREETRGIA